MSAKWLAAEVHHLHHTSEKTLLSGASSVLNSREPRLCSEKHPGGESWLEPWWQAGGLTWQAL